MLNLKFQYYYEVTGLTRAPIEFKRYKLEERLTVLWLVNVVLGIRVPVCNDYSNLDTRNNSLYFYVHVLRITLRGFSCH